MGLPPQVAFRLRQRDELAQTCLPRTSDVLVLSPNRGLMVSDGRGIIRPSIEPEVLLTC
jgi:hypothetical protein